MSVENLPLGLYKANAQLQLGITRLLQESGHCWLEAARQFSADGIEETTTQIENTLRAADWQTLVTLPSEVFWRLLQGQLGESRALAQTAVQSQSAFTSGLQQALVSWQQAVAETFGQVAETASVAHLFTPSQWTEAAAPTMTGTRAKAAK